MRHYILASHGTFSQGLYEAIKIIMGEQENVHIITAYVEDGFDLKQQIQKTIDSIPEDDEIITCTDIFGGSVNNEMMKYIRREKFYLLTGINLPILINIFLSKDENFDVLMEQIFSEELQGIVYCNRKKDKSVEEEDF